MPKSLYFFLGCQMLMVMTHAFPLGAEEMKPHRGQFPQCQETCLSTHQLRMEKLMKEYERQHEKVVYQEGVDKAVSDYKECITNCREPIPIK